MEGSPMSDKSASGVEQYAYSFLTDTWYRVHDWEDRGDGKILSQSKEEVSAEEVPDRWLDAAGERGDRDD